MGKILCNRFKESQEIWNEMHSQKEDYFDCLRDYNSRIVCYLDNIDGHQDELLIKQGFRTGYVKSWQTERIAFLEIDKINSSKKILDIGCGYGALGSALSRFVDEYHGVDISSYIINAGREAMKHAKISNVFLSITKDFLETFEDNNFDIVNASAVFIHITKEYMNEYVRQMALKLKHGGKCICHFFITVDNNKREAVAHDKWSTSQMYTEIEIDELFKENNFIIQSVYDWEWYSVPEPRVGFSRQIFAVKE